MNKTTTWPMLSIIVTCYNQADNIDETLQSLLAIDHDFDYEIVIGDDGSTDGSREKLSQYAEKYPNLIRLFLYEKNKGMVGNYYYLLSQCRGKYVGLCSIDDMWLPGKAVMQISYLDEHPEVGMVYGKCRNLYVGEGHKDMKPTLGRPPCDFHQLVRRNTIPAVTALYRRDLTTKYVEDIRPTEHGWHVEDYPMWLWFSVYSEIAFLDQEVAIYRIIQGSISHHKSKAKAIRDSGTGGEMKRLFSERFYGKGNVPPELEVYYTYYIFRGIMVRKDYAQLASMREDILRLRKTYKCYRTKKMAFAARHPRLYRGYRRMLGKY